jgi:hypothetical protein
LGIRREANTIAAKNLELQAAQYQATNYNNAQQIGLHQQTNAITLLSTLQAQYRADAENKMKGAIALYEGDTKKDIAQIKSTGALGSQLALVKAIPGYVSLIQDLKLSGDPEKVKMAEGMESSLGVTASDFAKSASIGQRGNVLENVISTFGFKVPAFMDSNPTKKRDLQAQFVKNKLETDARSTIVDLMDKGMDVPKDLYNVAFNLDVKPNAEFTLKNDSYIKGENEQVVTNGRKSPTREETFLSFTSTMAQKSRSGEIPVFSSLGDFLNFTPPGLNFKLGDTPEFKNINIAKKFFNTYQQLVQVK